MTDAPEPTIALDVDSVPAPAPAAEPDGFIVEADDGSRIHFLDWRATVEG